MEATMKKPFSVQVGDMITVKPSVVSREGSGGKYDQGVVTGFAPERRDVAYIHWPSGEMSYASLDHIMMYYDVSPTPVKCN
jgi:hypothetical protein